MAKITVQLTIQEEILERISMARRLTDTDKWRDRWFRSLSPEHKHFWTYLMENCNHAGIWDPCWDIVKLDLDNPQPYDPIAFGDHIVILSDGKWFIPDFLKTQYPHGLNQESRPLASVIKIIQEYGLLEKIEKGFPKGFLTLKDKDKDKDKSSSIYDKYKDKVNGQSYSYKNTNKIKADNVEAEHIYNIGQEPSPVPIDYTTEAQFNVLTEEVASLRKIGFTNVKVKSMYLFRGIPEVVIDKLLDRKF